jgi:hypothetical protein
MDENGRAGDRPTSSGSAAGRPRADAGSRALAPERRALALKRATLAGATALIAINIWTGAPILALWVGSRVVGSSALSMEAVFVVVVVLAVLVFAMALALAWLNASYDRLTGRPVVERRLAWLRSMRAEDPDEMEPGMRTSALELIVIFSVYVAMIALVVWFFAFAGSPLPG